MARPKTADRAPSSPQAKAGRPRKRALVSTRAFADHVGINATEVTKLIKMSGVFKDYHSSEMDTLRHEYVYYLRNAAAGKLSDSGGELISIDVEKAQLTRQKVIGEIRHNAAQAGFLVDKEYEIERLTKGVLAAKSILRGIPKTLRTAHGLSVAATQKVGMTIDEALLALAKEWGVQVEASDYKRKYKSKSRSSKKGTQK